MGPARVMGVERSHLWVSHGATAIKCANEQFRIEKEMREMMMRLGAEDPEKHMDHHQDNKI